MQIAESVWGHGGIPGGRNAYIRPVSCLNQTQFAGGWHGRNYRAAGNLEAERGRRDDALGNVGMWVLGVAEPSYYQKELGPFRSPRGGKLAVKVIDDCGDHTTEVFAE
jgi:hypothetical protein